MADNDTVDAQNPEAATQTTTEALEAAGLFVYDLGGGILNVHSEEVTTDGGNDDTSYLFTVTVTITP